MIGIMGAMDEEVDGIIKKLTNIKIEKISDELIFYIGKYNDKELIVCKSGIGMVNASITATILSVKFKVSSIIFSGVAGALKEGIEVGDIVIGDTFVEYMFDVTKAGKNYVKGQIAGTKTRDINADIKMLNKSKKIKLSTKIFYGRIISGDTFVSEESTKEALIKEFSPMAVDMESASVAHVCTKLNVPYLIIRSISDSYKGSYMEYEKFLKIASENSQKFLFEMIERID